MDPDWQEVERDAQACPVCHQTCKEFWQRPNSSTWGGMFKMMFMGLWTPSSRKKFDEKADAMVWVCPAVSRRQCKWCNTPNGSLAGYSLVLEKLKKQPSAAPQREKVAVFSCEDFRKHEEAYCEKIHIKCQICQRKTYRKMVSKDGTAYTYPEHNCGCTRCPGVVKRTAMGESKDTHDSLCPHWQCSHCEKTARTTTKNEHEPDCFRVCPHCRYEIPGKVYRSHTRKCVQGLCRVCGGCGEYTFMKDHKRTCSKRREKCNNCRRELYRCKCTNWSCSICKERVTCQTRENHWNTCHKPCLAYGCHNKVRSQSRHGYCPKCDAERQIQRQHIPCSLCHMSLRRDRIEEHQLKTCSKRLLLCVDCGNHCTADSLYNHLCLIQCRECGEQIPKEYIQKHRLICHQTPTNRPQEAVICPMCDINIDPSDIENHLNTCPQAKLQCPICLVMFKRKDKNEHSCPEVQCKGCGRFMALVSLEEHLRSECINRVSGSSLSLPLPSSPPSSSPSPSPSPSPAGPSSSSISPSLVVVSKGEEKEIDDDISCLICLDAPRDTVLLPCKHMSYCGPCAEQLKASRGQCAVCRGEIIDTMTLYT